VRAGIRAERLSSWGSRFRPLFPGPEETLKSTRTRSLHCSHRIAALKCLSSPADTRLSGGGHSVGEIRGTDRGGRAGLRRRALRSCGNAAIDRDRACRLRGMAALLGIDAEQRAGVQRSPRRGSGVVWSPTYTPRQIRICRRRKWRPIPLPLPRRGLRARQAALPPHRSQAAQPWPGSLHRRVPHNSPRFRTSVTPSSRPARPPRSVRVFAHAMSRRASGRVSAGLLQALQRSGCCDVPVQAARSR